MKIYFLMMIMFMLLLSGCNLFTSPQSDKYGLMSFYTTDSLGVMKNSFRVNEPIFLHSILSNPTSHNIVYKKYPWNDDSILSSYEIRSEADSLDWLPPPIGFPYDLLSNVTLKSHERKEQITPITDLSIGAYKIYIVSLIIWDPQDFQVVTPLPLHITIEEN